MAVYVLLQFDQDDEAKDFVGVVLNAAEGSAWKAMSVWGVFKKPTKFCECTSGRKTFRGSTRGLNYGWWICAQCKKPTRGWSSGKQWFTVLGTNLLPRSLRPYPDEMNPNLESPKVWSDLDPSGNSESPS